MKEFNSKDFKATKTSITKSGRKLAENVQLLIEMGLWFFMNHSGDTSKLTEALSCVQGCRSVKAQDVKHYIGAHANVRWLEPKDGPARFKMKGNAPEVTPPTQAWFEFSKNGKVLADKDIYSSVTRLRVATANALKSDEEGKRVKEEQREYAVKIVELLEQAEALASAMGLSTGTKDGKKTA